MARQRVGKSLSPNTVLSTSETSTEEISCDTYRHCGNYYYMLTGRIFLLHSNIQLFSFSSVLKLQRKSNLIRFQPYHSRNMHSSYSAKHVKG